MQVLRPEALLLLLAPLPQNLIHNLQALLQQIKSYMHSRQGRMIAAKAACWPLKVNVELSNIASHCVAMFFFHC